MSSGFPLPTSEYWALARNHEQLRRVAGGDDTPESVGRPVVTVVKRDAKRPPGTQIWRGPGFRVVQSYAPRR